MILFVEIIKKEKGRTRSQLGIYIDGATLSESKPSNSLLLYHLSIQYELQISKVEVKAEDVQIFR